MIKVGDLYKGRYEVVEANDFYFIIDNTSITMGIEYPEYDILEQGTFFVKWRYQEARDANRAFKQLTEKAEQDLEEILLKKE